MDAVCHRERRGVGCHAGVVTESDFRASLGAADTVRLSYRGLDCQPLGFDEFARAMGEAGVHSDIERAVDGTAITVTVRRRGGTICSSPYPPVAELPPFELRDLAGKRVNAASFKGKPTLINFYFAACVPCIREVEPLNRFAASRPGMNFLAMTFDDSGGRASISWRATTFAGAWCPMRANSSTACA